MRIAILLLIPALVFPQIVNFQWPLAPVDVQHRISATFDECREDRDHFHNGTDMPLAPGGQALSIMAGKVTGKGADWIRVEDFAYVHVTPLTTLDRDESVAKGAVVGHADSYAHIHLNYGGGASGHPSGNPLLPGKITPFEDTYKPNSPHIQLVLDGTNTPFPSNTVSGRVDIIAQASDVTDLKSSIDMNNGVYKISWALYSADTSMVLKAPYYYFEAKELYPNAYINTVYAPGSSTSIYRHIVTNKVFTNGYLDCDLYDPGNYVIAVMSCDTRDNWDTTYVPITISDLDLMPPGQPVMTFVGSDGSGGLKFEWISPSDADLAGFVLEFSFDGSTWKSNHGPDVLTAGMTEYTISNFPQGADVRFRLIAVDGAPIPNRSVSSDTYGVRLNDSGESILIVDGFDRTNGSWTKQEHDFACYYSDAIVNSGSEAGMSTASNEWVTAGGDLQNYDIVVWFVGDDSRTDETFSISEQTALSNFLTAGGHLFASGAEIGYDLSAGSTADKDFMNQVLHIGYAGDNSGSKQVNGVGNNFDGISFDYGAAPYLEDWPDHFTTSNGGENILLYGNATIAGVGYRDAGSSTAVIGFTFETIDTEDNQMILMDHILRYFGSTTSIDEIEVPVTSAISGIYPNPFNASVEINYTLEISGDTWFTVFDIKGREVFTQTIPDLSTGQHLWRWNATNNKGNNVVSGAYIIRISQEGRPAMSGKMLLLK